MLIFVSALPVIVKIPEVAKKKLQKTEYHSDAFYTHDKVLLALPNLWGLFHMHWPCQCNSITSKFPIIGHVRSSSFGPFIRCRYLYHHFHQLDTHVNLTCIPCHGCEKGHCTIFFIFLHNLIFLHLYNYWTCILGDILTLLPWYLNGQI